MTVRQRLKNPKLQTLYQLSSTIPPNL